MQTSLERVSTDSTGQQANGESSYPSISADGRYVAFASSASNLVAGDSNGSQDIFVKDLAAGETTRVSTDGVGLEANGGSYQPSISADGRYVAFESEASNLAAGDTNRTYDIFVKDLATGVMTRVSTGSAGQQANSGGSHFPSISADGRFVAFHSWASNLVAGDSNNTMDIFVKDLATGVTTRVSTDSASQQANDWSYYPSISADGRFVVFASDASNLVAGDSNDTTDIFVKDLATGVTARVSTGSAGQQANGSNSVPSISADGRFVAFQSQANLVAADSNFIGDVFVKDLVTGETTLVSTDSAGQRADGLSYNPSISADGRYIAFTSTASNLMAGDTNQVEDDVFVKDLATGVTTRVSTGSTGQQANGMSGGASISADGRYVAFGSLASNLSAGDTNGSSDVFVAGLPDLPPPTVGTEAADRLTGSSAADWLIARGGDDTLIAGAGNDQMEGNAGDDLLFGNGGNDSLSGSEGKDTMHGGDGDDTLDGGAGYDSVSFGTAAQGMIVDLAAGTASGDGQDVLRGIEEVFGSRFDDVIRGGAENNWFTGGVGNDTLDGGDGRDTASYADAANGVVVDLAAGTATGHGNDSLISIECVVGSRFDDVIRGGAENNWFTGGFGNDTLDGGHGQDTVLGGAGDDRLDGGDGSDWLSGGAGADTFSFAPPALAAKEVDRIADFTHGEDRIDLQAFHFADAAEVLARIASDGDHLVLDLGAIGGPQVIIDHVAALQADDFLI